MHLITQWADRVILHAYATGIPYADAHKYRFVAAVLVLKWVEDCVTRVDTDVHRLSRMGRAHFQLTEQDWADMESDMLVKVQFRLDLV